MEIIYKIQQNNFKYKAEDNILLDLGEFIRIKVQKLVSH